MVLGFPNIPKPIAFQVNRRLPSVQLQIARQEKVVTVPKLLKNTTKIEMISVNTSKLLES